MMRWMTLLLTTCLWAAPASARTVIDGPYVGVLPCADCPGIRTELALERDAATGAPRRYWLRETYLDAGVGKRKRDFVARATAREDATKGEGKEGDNKSESEAVIDERPSAAASPSTATGKPEPKRPDGSGSIEATLDARSVESMGGFKDEAARGGRSARVVLDTASGLRAFARISERVIEAVKPGGSTDTSAQNHVLRLQAGGASALAAPLGMVAAGIVTRDASDRLVLAQCNGRGALLLDDGARAPSVSVALDALNFARVGRAYLEVYGQRRGAQLRVVRVARASVDLDCAAAAPAPMSLVAAGSESGWQLLADIDGVRLSLPSATGVAQRGSTAVPLIWTWRDGRNEAAAATLRSGQIIVRATPRLCRDTMANTVYGLSAEMTYAGRRYEGCAWSAALEQP